jgi:hypothetical protein
MKINFTRLKDLAQLPKFSLVEYSAPRTSNEVCVLLLPEGHQA